jgi:hypothetical protein
MIVYVSRALDGSWMAVANSLNEAERLIEEREPDLVKRSGYQILSETLANFMAGKVQGVKSLGMKSTIVKWDGDDPIPEDAHIHPHKYPKVAEVIEGGDGIPTQTTYRRDPCR